MTFKEICEKTKERCAASAWERACLASILRHVAKDEGDHAAAQRLGTIKAGAVARAREILPHAFSLHQDAGMVGVRSNGRGSLHLPMRMLA